MSTNTEHLATIGPVRAEIFGEIWRFLLSCPKSAVFAIVISGVTGPILIRFAQNLANVIAIWYLQIEIVIFESV